MTIRALIADDEPLGRRRVRRLLAAERDVAVVGEADDGPAALAAIRRLSPDVVFLDVQMPGLDGLRVLEEVKGRRPPVAVFVTAYDQYAARAFDHHAADYLLKPIEAARFREAVDRVRLRLGESAGRRPAAGPAALERLLIRERGRAFFVRIEDVDWIEAAGNYVRVHVGRAAHRLRATVRSLEARLDQARFRRISRTALVNLNRVKELQPWFHGDAIVILETNARLTLSRRYRANLLEPHPGQ